MSASSRPDNGAETYAFRFDAPIATRVFGDEYNLSGWLLDPGGKPITGIRAVVKRIFAQRKIFPARRKRTRPDIAAAFPDLPDAKASGFLLELRLGFGLNHLTLQVRDRNRVWRTFQTATVWAFPFVVLRWLRLLNLRRFLISHLQENYSPKNRLLASRSGPTSFTTPANAAISTRRVDLFATSKSNLFILEIGELIAAGFRELGCQAQLHLDQVPRESRAPNTVQLVVTPHEYYNLFLSEKLSEEDARKLTRNLVLLCTEQPETGWFHSNLQWVRHARAVADINPLGALSYRAHGVPAQHFQLGFHPILTCPESTTHSERDYDITFLGSMTPRRDEFFAEHAPFFASRRCHLRFVPLDFAKTKITRSYLRAEHRNQLLNQSKILLNLHYSEREYFEWHRCLVALANECCLISETSEGYGPLVPGKHFVMAQREDLIACCEYYLNHPAECEAIGRRASQFIRTELRQAEACRQFLQEMEALDHSKAGAGHDHVEPFSRSPIDPDLPPIPSPPELRRNFSQRKARLLKRALADDLRTWLGRSVTLPSSGRFKLSDDSATDRPAMMEKRQGYKARWAEQELRRARGEAVWQFYDNQAYAAASDAHLSVVVTLFNYAHYIGHCLTSISEAAERISGPVEVVIVNDASTDDSLAQAIRCQTGNKLPMRIVDKRFNTGLADARNVGVQNAQATYVFMMDADNLIFPKGLSELLSTIQSDDYAAAYSLLCRFHGTPANRIGLLSYFDWDPQILVQHPYIDAMAMFRRDALLEAGGYDNELSQIGWFGWEDYDMWLRFAQSNYSVGFVPNILCLYRHHERSMIHVTNLFETELVRHFLDRYGELVARFEARKMLFGVARVKIAGALESAPANDCSANLADVAK